MGPDTPVHQIRISDDYGNVRIFIISEPMLERIVRRGFINGDHYAEAYVKEQEYIAKVRRQQRIDEEIRRREAAEKAARDRYQASGTRSANTSSGTFSFDAFFDSEAFRVFFEDVGFTFSSGVYTGDGPTFTGKPDDFGTAPPHTEYKSSRPKNEPPRQKAPGSSGKPMPLSREAALAELGRFAKCSPHGTPEKTLLRRAMRHAHPDAGGTHEDFIRVGHLAVFLGIN